MPKEFSIYDAKAQLSALVRQVRETGQTFVITVHGEPVAELRPVSPGPGRATFGADRGRVAMRDDFEAPVDDLKPFR